MSTIQILKMKMFVWTSLHCYYLYVCSVSSECLVVINLIEVELTWYSSINSITRSKWVLSGVSSECFKWVFSGGTPAVFQAGQLQSCQITARELKNLFLWEQIWKEKACCRGPGQEVYSWRTQSVPPYSVGNQYNASWIDFVTLGLCPVPVQSPWDGALKHK